MKQHGLRKVKCPFRKNKHSLLRKNSGFFHICRAQGHDVKEAGIVIHIALGGLQAAKPVWQSGAAPNAGAQ